MEPIIISASFFQEQLYLGVLGRTGEHEARRISFDCSEVLKTWPEATILCVCRRPCDTAAYPISLTTDGTTYTMPLMSRETAAAGTIKLELRAVQDDTVLKSAIFYGRILPSLNGQKDAPGNPLSDALNRLESTIADAQTLADEIHQKLDNGEFVGERGPQGEPGKDGSDATVTAQNIESALGYAPVKDVQVAGSSVLEDGVANVPIASATTPGTIKIGSPEDSGMFVDMYGNCYISYATYLEIDNRTAQRKTIICRNLDYAVKSAMCDGKGAAWTDAEQKAARERIGLDKPYELIEEITTDGTSIIERNVEPDGTPYNFKAIFIEINSKLDNVDGYNLYLTWENVGRTPIWIDKITGNTNIYTKIAYVEALLINELWHVSYRQHTTDNYITNVQEKIVPDAAGNITKFGISKAITAGVKLKIYGVRA